jgi:polyketide biosynthesis acyl carrier protein
VTRDQVLAAVRHNVTQVLPDLDPARIVPERSLTELGANSIDRMDVVVGSLEDLDLEIPGHRLAGAKDIGSLVEVLWSYASGEDT